MSVEKYVLYSWGANSYGQLGLGHIDDKLLPCEVQISSSQAKILKQIAGGGGHTVILTSEGTVFVCGWNKHGQLGVASSDSDPPPVYVPILSPIPNLQWRVKKVACGWNHTLGLTEDGGVITWGSNSFGQLGLPDIEKQANKAVCIPREVFDNCHVTDLSAGLRHSIAVTDEGHLYSWGSGKKGQLGHGRKELGIHQSPRHIQLSSSTDKCVAVCAGGFHSTALSKDGSLLSWGLNQHGQCGHGPLKDEHKLLDGDHFLISDATGFITTLYQPLMVKGVAPISDVQCGWSHTLVIIRSGREVLGWGRNDYGQLGQPARSLLSPSGEFLPTEVPTLKGIEQMKCGSEHNIAINGLMRPVTFGWNEHGMCGSDDEVNVELPTEVPNLLHGKTVLVGSGAGHTMALIVSL